MSEKWNVDNFTSWKSEEFPPGAVCIDAGNSKEYITGGWRAERPVWDEEACKNCLFCWVYCPDSSIIVEDGKMTGIDYDHCKGCGVCAHECPFGALNMIFEADAKEAE